MTTLMIPFLVVVFCVIVITPRVLCGADGVDSGKKKGLMGLWGATSGLCCIFAFGYLMGGSLPSLGELAEYVGTLLSGEMGWKMTLVEILPWAASIIIGGLVGYMTQDTHFLSIIGRLVRIVVILLVALFVIALLKEILDDSRVFWVLLAIGAVLAGLGMSNPHIILIIFK